VDPRTGLDDMGTRRIFLFWNSNSDPSVVQPVASRYTTVSKICLELHRHEAVTQVVTSSSENCEILFSTYDVNQIRHTGDLVQQMDFSCIMLRTQGTAFSQGCFRRIKIIPSLHIQGHRKGMPGL
jgi:hypothetical protein